MFIGFKHANIIVFLNFPHLGRLIVNKKQKVPPMRSMNHCQGHRF